MKHLSQIQSEFLKNAVWEDNPEGYQRQYLRRHPKSKKRLRVRPIVQINQQNPEAETIEILKEFSKLPYDSFYGDSLHTTRDLLKQEKPSLYDLYRIMDRWYGIATNSVYQQQNPEQVEKIGLLTRALKDKEQQKLIDKAKRQTAESLTVDDEDYLYSLQQKDPMIKDLADDILKDVREKGMGQEDEVTGVSGEDLESIDLITKDIIQKMKDRRKSTNKMPANEDIGNEVDEQLDDESTDIKERVKKEVARILQEESSSFAAGSEQTKNFDAFDDAWMGRFQPLKAAGIHSYKMERCREGVALYFMESSSFRNAINVLKTKYPKSYVKGNKLMIPRPEGFESHTIFASTILGAKRLEMAGTMKHLAVIQSEFFKEARKWDKLSLEDQKAYLTRHPKSKRKITAINKELNRKLLNTIIKYWQRKGVWIDTSNVGSNFDFYLDAIQVDEQNKGLGTKAMNDLINYADKVKATIYLEPSNEFGSSVVRLRKFYKNFGFKNKGKQMTREPQ